MQRRALTRPFTCQSSQLIAAQGDGLLQRINLPVGLGQWRFGLTDFEMRADPAFEATLRQIEYLLLLGQRCLGDIQSGVFKGQLNVGANHVFLQFELRLTLLGSTHVSQIKGLLAGIAFTSPEVQRVAQTQRRIVVPGASIGQRSGTIKLILGPVVAHQAGTALHLHRLG